MQGRWRLRRRLQPHSGAERKASAAVRALLFAHPPPSAPQTLAMPGCLAALSLDVGMPDLQQRVTARLLGTLGSALALLHQQQCAPLRSCAAAVAAAYCSPPHTRALACWRVDCLHAHCLVWACLARVCLSGKRELTRTNHSTGLLRCTAAVMSCAASCVSWSGWQSRLAGRLHQRRASQPLRVPCVRVPATWSVQKAFRIPGAGPHIRVIMSRLGRSMRCLLVHLAPQPVHMHAAPWQGNVPG